MLSARYGADGQAAMALNPGQMAARDIFLRKLNDGIYSLELHGCLICSGIHFESLARKDRYGLPMSVVVCRDCGLVQTTPRLTEQSFREFYDSEYRPLYVGDSRPTHQFFASQLEQGRKILFRLEKETRIKFNGLTVVEIGCGAGGILEAFRARGCRVLGFDWGRNYLAFGQREFGLDLRVGGLASLKPDVRPDVVIYSHVLEHVPDPRAELRRLRWLIRPETLVYIEAPGVKNVIAAYDADFLLYLQNAHVSHFTAQTLKNLITLERFEPVFCNDLVECICRPASGAAVRGWVNDTDPVLSYLRHAEARLPYRRRNPVHRMRKHAVAILSRLGLKETARRVLQS